MRNEAKQMNKTKNVLENDGGKPIMFMHFYLFCMYTFPPPPLSHPIEQNMQVQYSLKKNTREEPNSKSVKVICLGIWRYFEQLGNRRVAKVIPQTGTVADHGREGSRSTAGETWGIVRTVCVTVLI
jgi:hypothetical protein